MAGGGRMMLEVLVGLALSADSFSTMLACNCANTGRKINPVVTSASFTLFQVGMLVMGWAVGTAIIATLPLIDHWISFVLLTYAGASMAGNALQMEREVHQGKGKEGWDCLLFLSIATSVDAFLVGMGLAILKTDFTWLAAVVGIITFLTALLGYSLRDRLDERYGKYAEIAGGVIIVAIGINLLIIHLLFMPGD
jgi:putative Mn2+ efflux pump MntP